MKKLFLLISFNRTKLDVAQYSLTKSKWFHYFNLYWKVVFPINMNFRIHIFPALAAMLIFIAMLVTSLFVAEARYNIALGIYLIAAITSIIGIVKSFLYKESNSVRPIIIATIINTLLLIYALLIAILMFPFTTFYRLWCIYFKY